MSERSRTRSQKRSRGRNRSRGMMGGSHADVATTIGSTGGGAAGWALSNFGNGNAQWNNTFGPQSLGINTGNLLPTLAGAPAVLTGMSPQGINPPSQLFKMSGGRRRKMKKTKGGMGMITAAAVPLTLLALQQSYGSRRKGSSRKGSRRRGSRRGSRRR